MKSVAPQPTVMVQSAPQVVKMFGGQAQAKPKVIVMSQKEYNQKFGQTTANLIDLESAPQYQNASMTIASSNFMA